MRRPRRPRVPRWAQAISALLALLAGTAASAAELRVEPVLAGKGRLPHVVIEGAIAPGDWSRFMKLLRAHPELRGVALASDGGALDDGLAIARQIHERGLDTTLLGNCHSVCAIMFLAGREKFVPPRFQLSVHSAYRQLGSWTARDESANDTVTWFLGAMGYPLALARLWNDTAPEDVAYVTWTMNERWDLGFQRITPPATVRAAGLAPWTATPFPFRSPHAREFRNLHPADIF